MLMARRKNKQEREMATVPVYIMFDAQLFHDMTDTEKEWPKVNPAITALRFPDYTVDIPVPNKKTRTP